MKTAKELFNELKNESFVFYGSGACAYYSGAEEFEGLVFTEKEFEEIKENTPELLPETEVTFYELDGKHSATEGSEFCQTFKSLEEYYIWYMNNNINLESAYDCLLGYAQDTQTIAKTSMALHSLDDWKRESVFDYIGKNYEVKQIITLVKKEND